jgi:MFS family permease
MTRRQERVFLLVGLAALFAGYDMNLYGFAIPQIQASLNIPEDQVGPTVMWFRLAAFGAVGIAASADLVGRRRLLLFTIVGQGLATLATAFSQTRDEFIWLQITTRIFGYSEEMLCVVVIVEEVDMTSRGWANGMLAAMGNQGAGIAAIVFGFVNILPYHWRALYVIGAVPLFIVGYLRRRLPETKRFAIHEEEVRKVASRASEALILARRLALEHPARLAAVLIAVAAWGFAIAPAGVLGNKFLQQTLGYAPQQTTMLLIPGGFIALVLNIRAGRLSDRLGRKRVLIPTLLLGAVAFAGFYSGVRGWLIPPLWVAAYFSLFTCDALLAGFATELFPTAYRATVSGLRYTAGTLGGALSLKLEGSLYDHFHAHGPAISVFLAAVPITAIALAFLPEAAGKSLEEIAGEPEPAVPLLRAEV